MSKKDYIILARIFAGLSNASNQMFTKDYLVQMFCVELKKDNGRFDSASFLTACTAVDQHPKINPRIGDSFHNC